MATTNNVPISTGGGEARDPRIIGGTPEEMEAKDAVADGNPETALASESPVLSETPVIDRVQANADVSELPVPATDDINVFANRDAILALSARINRIVDALSRSKSVKNL